MKKIGILTRRAGFNHGSSLQAYAMAKFIGDAGYDCEIIDYDEYSGHPQWKIRPFIENIQWSLPHSLLRVMSSSKYEYLKIRSQQYNRFEIFEKNYLKLTPIVYHTYKTLKSVAEKYDAVVCGSDQIWCPLLYDPVFLFAFLKDSKVSTVAYAPSIGTPEIDLIGNEQRKLMNRIRHLSCREEQGADMVKTITGRTCEVVLDPTLMVNVEHWNELASSIDYIEYKDYILCYFLGKNVHQSYIDELKRKTGYKVINILMFNRLNDLKCDRTITDVGPLEFLNLIKNAAHICTDSFHGTIFSLQFEKHLSLFERFKTGEKANQNSRIYTLLKNLKCENVLVKEESTPNMDNIIEAETFKTALQKWRQKSLIYIKQSLNDTNS